MFLKTTGSLIKQIMKYKIEAIHFR